jgi:hypothetical protein
MRTLPPNEIANDVTLDRALLAAHAAGDHAALVTLYRDAATLREQQGDVDAACFYLTHAYVFALEQGAGGAEALRTRLMEYGREE